MNTERVPPFTKRGLVPEYECYDVCSNARRFFIAESLRNLVETGQGKPEFATADKAEVPRDEFFQIDDEATE